MSGDVASPSAPALVAMRGGRVVEARVLLEKAVVAHPADLAVWLNLAGACRALGDVAGAFSAVENALRIEPRSFQALLMKASLVERSGDMAQAAIGYGLALTQAPPVEQMDAPTRRAFDHAREVHDDYTERLRAHLTASVVGEKAPLAGSEESRRINAFIDHAIGRRRLYAQKPSSFYYPGLPAIEFYPRDLFPWIEAVEASAKTIARELSDILSDGAERGFNPYVDYDDSLPLDQWAELNHSPRWNAFHLEKDGKRVEANCIRAEATLRAISIADRADLPGRSPASMFSTLKPHTRIPPHTGVSNTRLVVHLALVVPPGCGFRVGGETRPWTPGEVFVFDDTLEHEAWNEGDLPRTVLIFDVWSPLLSPRERDLIRRVTHAADDFGYMAPARAATEAH